MYNPEAKHRGHVLSSYREFKQFLMHGIEAPLSMYSSAGSQDGFLIAFLTERVPSYRNLLTSNVHTFTFYV